MKINCFDFFIKPLKGDKEQTVADYIDRTEESFADSTSYREVYKNYDFSQTYGVRIVEDTNAYRKEVVGKKLIMPPDGGINQGDYIHIKDENDIWLVTGYDALYDERKTAFIQLCGDSTLKWYDENNKLQEWDSIIGVPNSRGGGFVTDRQMMTSIGYLPIVVQNNIHTRRIAKDHRFVFGTSAYRVTFIDDYSGSKGNNLIRFELTVTETLDADDFVEGIAYNSWANKDYDIKILNNDIDGVVGDTYTVEVEVYHNDVEVNEDVGFVSLDNSIATVSNLGQVELVDTGETQIKVYLSDNEDIFSYITVTCTEVVADNRYIALSASSGTAIDNAAQEISTILQTTPEITITSWLNGETYDDTYTVEIIDGESNLDAVLADNIVTLTLNSVGNAVMRITDDLDNQYDYDISIKTLF